MKIAIVGVGAMGGLFAYWFSRSGYNPWLLDTCQQLVDVIKKDGLKVEDGQGTHRVSFQTVTTKPEEIGIVDLVVVFVKAYDTEKAMRGAVSLMGEETVVLTLQNGLNNMETIAGIAGKNRTIGGMTAHGATRLSHGHIRHAGVGETIIGSLKGIAVKGLGKTKNVLDTSGIKTRLTDDMEGMIWSKLIINAAINPLTALTRLTNGDIVDHSGLRDVQVRVVEEACAVARAKGMTIHYRNPLEKIKDVCKHTASNQSSMLQDVLNGKKTEIDYINGAIAFEGRKHGVSTPYNDILTRLVKALEIERAKD